MKRVLLSTVIILTFLSSCMDFPEDIKAPTWDIELNVPILDTLYYLDEIIRVDDNIKIDSSSGKDVYYIESETYKKYFSVSTFIKNQLDGIFQESVPVLTGDSLIGIAISSGAEIDSAHLKSGLLTIKITNTSSESVDFSIEMPKFIDTQGNKFGFNGTIPANSNYNNSFNLENYEYSARDQTNKAELQIYVDSEPSNPSPDVLQIDLSLTQSDFYYVEGKLPTKKVRDINEIVELPISDDIEDLRNNLEFTDAEMIISAKYLSGFENVFSVEFQDFTILGRNENNETKNLTDRDGNPNLGDILVEQGEFERTYNNSNSNVSEFLSFLPEEVIVISGIFMNPTNSIGIATDKDSIEVNFQIKSSSEIRIKEVSLLDTLEFEMDNDIREEILNGRLIELVYDIENGIPLEHEMSLIFTDSLFNPLFTKQIELPGADVLDNNKNYSPEVIKDKLQLNNEEVLLLAQSYNIILDWRVFTDQRPLTAFFSKDQYFKIKTYCKAVYNVNLEEEDDENEK